MLAGVAFRKVVPSGILVGTAFAAFVTESIASPSNDHFANRSLLSGESALVGTYLTGATVESGEPSHAGENVVRSLWWSWTAPATGWANFSTRGSGRPLTMAVYTGDSLATLSATAVNSPPLSAEDNSRSDSINVPVIAGQDYQIAIATDTTHSSNTADRVVLGVNQSPIIVSRSLVHGMRSETLRYQISATCGATSFDATGLPPGMTLNSVTGLISGAPSTLGTFDARISATAPGGTASATVRFDIAPDDGALRPPEFTFGDPIVRGFTGNPIAAAFYGTDVEMSQFTLDPSLSGLTTNNSDSRIGQIRGTPTSGGLISSTLRAVNSAGATTAQVSLQIFDRPPLPLINGPAVAYGAVGESFSYSVGESSFLGLPRLASFSVGNLPPGLLLDQNSRIRGIPAETGIFEVPITAMNLTGATTATLTIAIGGKGEPVSATGNPLVTSPAGAAGIAGESFLYSITSLSPASSYSATGLPRGITLDPKTGLISGIPLETGTFQIEVSATNETGTTTAPVTIAIRSPKPPMFTSPAGAVASVGTAFKYQLVAILTEMPTNLFSGSGITLRVGTLPPGLSWGGVFPNSPDRASTYISGTPTAAGTYRVPVSASRDSVVTNAILTIVITETDIAPPVFTSAAAVSGNVGSMLYHSLSASNAPTNFTVTNLPPGLSFEAATNEISGKPTASGVFVVDASASNIGGTGTAKISFIIEPPTDLTFTGAALSEAFVGESFSSSVSVLSAAGGTATFSAENLPPGIQISTSGNFSGTPTAAGTYYATITARSGAQSAQVIRTFVVRPNAIPPEILSPLSQTGYAGTSFNYFLQISGRFDSYTIGDLPTGLTESGRSISGTPTTPGVYEVPVSATNAGITTAAILRIIIEPREPAPKWNTPASVRLYTGHSKTVDLSASGNVTAIELEGLLPPGMTFDPSLRKIIGVPSQMGLFPVRITASGPGGSETTSFTLVVSDVLPPPLITCPLIVNPQRIVGRSDYNFYLTATNYPVSFHATNFPYDLRLNPLTGLISGWVYISNREFPIDVSATNATGTSTASVTLVPTDSGSRNSFGPAMTLGAVGAPFRYVINGSFTTSSAYYSAEELPDGLFLDPKAGVISGIPTTPGTYRINLRVPVSGIYNYVGELTAGATLTVHVPDDPESPLVTSPGILRGAVGSAFQQSVKAETASGFAIDQLPPGLTLNSATGEVLGTPTAAGRYSTHITASNSGGETVCEVIFDIAPAPEIPKFTSYAQRSAAIGQLFSYSVTATNQPTSIEAEGLPEGLVINSKTGKISGIPSAAGRFPVLLKATNAGGTGVATMTLDVLVPNSPTFSVSPIEKLIIGNSYSRTLYGYNDSWITFEATNLPPGLSINATTGEINGVPTSAGTYSAQLTATNAGGSTVVKVTYQVAEGALETLANGAGVTGLVGESMDIYLSTESGTPFSFSADELPPGLALIGRNIVGRPTQAGTWHARVNIRYGNRESSAILTFQIENSPRRPPAVTSPLTVAFTMGATNICPITADHLASAITAEANADGLEFDAVTSSMRGFPEAPGSYPVTVTASNSIGTASAEVTVVVLSSDSIVASNPANTILTAGKPVRQSLSLAGESNPYYTLEFPPGPSPTVAVRGLPPGLYMNPATKEVAGTATLAGDYPVEFIVTDAFGNSTTTHTTYRVSGGSADTTSSLKVSYDTKLYKTGAIGSPLSVETWPDGVAEEITAEGLPPGMVLEVYPGISNSVATKFAKITGKPASPGDYPVRIAFRNDSNVATAVVTVSIPEKPLPPLLSSSFVAKGETNRAFNYTLYDSTGYLFNNEPTSYSFSSLPPGLAFDPETRCITGTPQTAGKYAVPVSLTNAGGTSEAVLNFMITDLAGGNPELLLEDSVTEAPASTLAFNGRDFELILRSTTLLDSISINGLPNGLTYDPIIEQSRITGVKISGTTSQPGRFSTMITATSGTGSSQIPLTIDVREFDSFDDIPTFPPFPTPQPVPPGKPAQLRIRTPSIVETEKPNYKVVGKLTHYDAGKARVFARIRPGRGWQEIEVMPNGRFRLKVADLPPGRIVITLRLRQKGERPSTRKIRIFH